MKPDFPTQITLLQQDTLQSLVLFSPELALCATIVLALLLRIVVGRRLNTSLLAFLGSAVALGFAISQCCADIERQEIFTGMLVFDQFAVFMRIFLLSFLVLFVLMTMRTGIPDREDAPDFFTLALGATLGMCLMATANHLLVVFLAIEMASVPSYALAGILKGRRQASEAALKFAVYGAGAAGVMLYGISLLAGVVGSVHFPTAAGNLATLMLSNPSQPTMTVLALGGLMVMVGLAFKLSAVPFQFWAPDVFEGASAEIGGFLSVASKAAALALLIRVGLGLSYLPDEAPQTSPLNDLPSAQARAEAAENRLLYVSTDAPAPALPQTPVAAAPVEGTLADSAAAVTASRSERMAALEQVRRFIAGLIAALAAATATFGNLAAYRQTNIKRLLAYSTIAHAGYMMMPVAAAMALSGTASDDAARAIGTLGFYIAMYLFMNLGAFLIVALLRNELRSEDIGDYAGLLQRSPGIAVCFCLILLSLIGIPPLAGFAAKFVIFGALADAGMITVLIIAGLNTVLSLFYYLRVIKVIAMEEPKSSAPVELPVFGSINGLFVLALTLPLLVFGVFAEPILAWAMESAKSLL